VNPQIARSAGALAIAAVAVAGCGGESVRSQPRHVAAAATTGMTRAEAFARADRVAVVVALRSRVVEGAPGTPFTQTEFRVKRLLKGTLARRFRVRVIGGRLHDTFVTPVVQPFRRSHRYLLFLGPDGPAGPTIFPDPIIEMKRGPP
jgi:hypothetical protein